jgi:hypothetical protein
VVPTDRASYKVEPLTFFTFKSKELSPYKSQINRFHDLKTKNGYIQNRTLPIRWLHSSHIFEKGTDRYIFSKYIIFCITCTKTI